jgi:hypothetical protein
MEPNRILGMVIAYYFSRFDKDAINSLGYSRQGDAFSDIAKRLKVKPNTLKNWRDEFDPIHRFRRGWYQRPMSPSRVRVVEALQDLSMHALHQIVLDILHNERFKETEDGRSLIAVIAGQKKIERDIVFAPRTPTGNKAEEIFVDWFRATSDKPFDGRLIDTRDLGTGYDFEVRGDEEIFYIEVKGLAGSSGGISFTDKEWQKAVESRGHYFLFLVSDIGKKPAISIVENPAEVLVAKKRVYTTVQVNWIVDRIDT